MNQIRRFEGKTVLVTGAAQGMGEACAMSFAREGARVVALDVSKEANGRMVAGIVRAGGQAMAIGCDIARVDDIHGAVEEAEKKFGAIDILINNAGVLRQTAPAELIPEAEWDLVMNVNLKGAFFCATAVLPGMKRKGWGRIVNISSSAGRSTSELGGAHYTISKTGVLGMTRHLAREYGSHGITVNSVCPGLVETPMIRQQANEERLAYWIKQIPVGRFADPREVADLAMFLASDQASYITGATIDFNGGSLLV